MPNRTWSEISFHSRKCIIVTPLTCLFVFADALFYIDIMAKSANLFVHLFLSVFKSKMNFRVSGLKAKSWRLWRTG